MTNEKQYKFREKVLSYLDKQSKSTFYSYFTSIIKASSIGISSIGAMDKDLATALLGVVFYFGSDTIGNVMQKYHMLDLVRRSLSEEGVLEKIVQETKRGVKNE